MIITATIIIYSLAQDTSAGRARAWRPLRPQPSGQQLAVHGLSGGTGHCPPGRHPDLPLETSLSLESPGKEGQALVLSGRGAGTWPQAPVSSMLAPQPQPPWRVETALTACGCRMWFWNFPTPPAIGCPAPHTLPQAQIGHVGRLSSYSLHPRGGGDGVGGLSLGHLCGGGLNPPGPAEVEGS